MVLAFVSCAAAIAKNIVKDCDHPNVGGYTGRAILIPLSNTITWAVNAQNPRIVSGITLGQGDKVCVVDNVWPGSFNDSATQSNGDDGRVTYDKTFTFRIPLRGGAVSKDIVEPLVDAPLGFAAIIEKRDQSGDGSYEIVGKFQGLKANADGITRNENENGGDVVAVMSCREPFFETTLFDTDYETTRAAFEELMQLAF